jgi:hypothetical protein
LEENFPVESAIVMAGKAEPITIARKDFLSIEEERARGSETIAVLRKVGQLRLEGCTRKSALIRVAEPLRPKELNELHA